jgi:hypothetical protein
MYSFGVAEGGEVAYPSEVNKFAAIYIVGLHRGINCQVHKKEAGIVRSATKAIGTLGGAGLLGRYSWPKIQPKITPYVRCAPGGPERLRPAHSGTAAASKARKNATAGR